MAFSQSSKLGSMLSGIFESSKTEVNAAHNDEATQVVQATHQAQQQVTQSSDAPATTRKPAHESADLSDETVDVSPESANPALQEAALQEAESQEAPSAEEAALVASAQADPAAFGELYERYVERIYAYIYHRVGNAQDAEDLTARTFYRALDKLHTYEDRGFPFSAWLFRIAHNLVANWHRDHSRRHFLSLDRLWSHSQDTETPEHVVERAERHSALWAAINRLPEERRSLLLYKFGSRLSNVEIGELMDKSESAIKSLYFRTLAALRTDLEARDW